MLIRRLLILVLLSCGAFTAARSQQGPVKPVAEGGLPSHADTVKPRPGDSLLRAADSLQRLADSLHFLVRGRDSAGAVPGDSLRRMGDSLGRMADSLGRLAKQFRQRGDSLRRADSIRLVRADTLLSATAMLHQVDSMNAAPAGGVDSVKLRLDGMLNNAAASQRNAVTAGSPGSLTQKSPNAGYTPGAGVAGASGATMGSGGGGGSGPGPSRSGGTPLRRPGLAPPVLSNLHEKYIPVTGGRGNDGAESETDSTKSDDTPAFGRTSHERASGRAASR